MCSNRRFYLETILMTVFLTCWQPCLSLRNALLLRKTLSRSFSPLPRRIGSHIVDRQLIRGPRTRFRCITGEGGVELNDVADMKHLMGSDSQIHDYWINQISRLQHGAARMLIAKLIPDNCVGYVGVELPKAGSMFGYYVKEKTLHPECVILMRVGDFYETYGVDALMLVAYCGLNSMAGKARAGCPIAQIQSVLDKLTAQGLTVAVYEEKKVSTSDTVPDTKKVRKDRYLSQTVSPADKLYKYDLSLRTDDIQSQQNVPIVGIAKTISGYILCQIYLDEEVIVKSEKLTAETVKVLLASSGHDDPVYLGYYHDHPNNVDKSILGPNVLSEKPCIVDIQVNLQETMMLELVKRISGLKVKEFRIRSKEYTDGPRPAYISTASQIGLIKNPNVPYLVDCLLPNKRSRSALSAVFLKRWISNPPTRDLASHMRSLCVYMDSTASFRMPLCGTLDVSKVHSLLKSGQGNAALFRDIKVNVAGVLQMLTASTGVGEKGEKSYNEYDPLIPHLLAIVTSETGEATRSEELSIILKRVLLNINMVIATEQESKDDEPLKDGRAVNRIDERLFTTAENSFRGKLSRKNPSINKLYLNIEAASAALIAATKEDYPPDVPIKYDSLNSMIYLTELEKKVSKRKTKKVSVDISAVEEDDDESDSDDDVTTSDVTDTNDDVTAQVPDKNEISGLSGISGISAPIAGDSAPNSSPKGVNFIRPIDRNFKVIAKGHTTQKVVNALRDYLAATAKGEVVIQEALESLSGELFKDVIGIEQAATWGIVLKAAADHVSSSRQKNWCIPDLLDFPEDNDGRNEMRSKMHDDWPEMKLTGLSPYWIDRYAATLNDVALQGTFLLTAPNMSGKSTLMRSVLVAALLANCGLYVPCTYAKVPKYDNFFLRTTSHDVPSEKKSAFALEMEDMRIIDEDSTPRSLIMIDELGKGTSSKDGACLAGAILEDLDKKKVSCIFATHLHELLSMSLKLKNTKYKRMGFEKQNGGLNWTYKLEDGQCTDSHALFTAAKYGINNSIIARAEQLGAVFDSTCRPPVLGPKTLDSITSGPKTLDSMDSKADITLDSKITSETTEITDPTEITNPTTSGQNVGSISGYKYNVNEIKNLVQALLRDQVTRGNLKSWPMTYEVSSGICTPPNFEGSACVYVLLLQRDDYDSIYVGETESIGQRLSKHRSTYETVGLTLTALITTVPNKSVARQIETILQRKFMDLGYVLESTADSKNKMFSN